MAEAQKRRIVFMGTPEFAAIILKKIIDSHKYEISRVYSQPDKKAGRGLKTIQSEVKQLALEYNLPLFQPVSLKSEDERRALLALNPDYIIVAAYGLLLPQNILDIPAIAPINVHASLLPAYRGAAPVQRALMDNWEKGGVSGISIMKMVKALDAGPVYVQEEIPINGDYFKTYESRLACAGGELLLSTLEKIEKNNLQPREQDESGATYAPKLEKSDGNIEWNKPAARIDALVRALTPWPGAKCCMQFSGNDSGQNVAILSGVTGDNVNNEQPGTISRQKDGLRIACADKWYNVINLKPEGRKEMSSAAFANGQCKLKTGICGRVVPCK